MPTKSVHRGCTITAAAFVPVPDITILWRLNSCVMLQLAAIWWVNLVALLLFHHSIPRVGRTTAEVPSLSLLSRPPHSKVDCQPEAPDRQSCTESQPGSSNLAAAAEAQEGFDAEGPNEQGSPVDHMRLQSCFVS